MNKALEPGLKLAPPISKFDSPFTPNNPSSIVLVTTTGLPLRFSDEIFISTMKVRTRDSRLN